MYDDEEEIKKKRRKLIIIIFVIVFIIVLLLIFLFTLKPKAPTVELKCVLTPDRDPDRNGTYTDPVVFTITSEGNNIVEQNVGVQKNAKTNRETYTVSQAGKTTLIGYVEDSKGNSAVCNAEVEVDVVKPTCTLKTSVEGKEDWYNKAVVVSFDSMDSNSDATIESSTLAVDSGDKTEESVEVKENGKHTVTGTIVDSEGNEGTCELDVNIDTEKPTCSLKVTEGKPNDIGIYTGKVVVEFEGTKDSDSGISEKGIDLNENYKKETYTIDSNGNYNVSGYVKDKAGNTGICTLNIKRNSTGKPFSVPTCELEVAGTQYNGTYYGHTTIKFKSKASTEGATIDKFGIGTQSDYSAYQSNKTEFLNGKDSYVVTGNETVTLYGMVKDSYGEVATCKIENIKVSQEVISNPTCSLRVTRGSLSGSAYLNSATVGMDYSSTNGAKIVKTGITTSPNPTLNGNNTIDLGAGSYAVYGIVQDSNGRTANCGPLNVNVVAGYPLLSSVVTVGSRVVYDVGTWNSTPGMPSANYAFGGYTAGTSKSTGVKCEGSNTRTNDGWMVISNSNGVVKITTVGNPECFKLPLPTAGNKNAKNYLNNEASKNFTNGSYAQSVTNMDEATARSLSKDILKTGGFYFLSSDANGNNAILGVSMGGDITYYSGRSYGIRPVVTLKPNVYSSGTLGNAYVLTTSQTRDMPEIITEQSFVDKVLESVQSIDL